MKATLVLNDEVYLRVKQEAGRRRTTISSFVETALERALQARVPAKRLRPLPTFHGGDARVDINDREALYDAMEGKRVHR